MKKINNLLLISIYAIFAIVIFQSCSTKTYESMSQWRGPNRDGIYPETNLLDQWPENGPDLLWSYDSIGNGYGSPSISGNKIFINGEKDSSSYLFAFNLDGHLLWQAPNGKEFSGDGFSSTYPGARSTPTVVDDLVYASSGKGRIACYETTTGAEKWAVDLVKDLGGSTNYFGYSESLLVDNSKVYSFAGGAKNNMVAFDRFTGDTVWTSEAMQDTFSYCSPIFIELPTRKVIVTHSRHFLYAVDCNTGQALGSYELLGFEYDGEHCNSPLFADGFIYFVSNDNEGDGAVKLELTSNGDQIKQVWNNKQIHNNFNGYVKVDNKLFTTVNGNKLISLNAENGDVVDSIKVATGSLIYADNKFICYGMNGEINLILHNENKNEIAGTFRVKQGTKQHFAHPVLADGKMYIRHGNSLMAYDLRKKD